MYLQVSPEAFAAIVAILNAPFLLLAFAFEAWCALRTTRRIPRLFLAFIATALGSLAVEAAILSVAPDNFEPLLRIRFLTLAGLGIPVCPPVIVAIGMVTPLVTLVFLSQKPSNKPLHLTAASGRR